ncbi:BC1872 family protein [Bacillus sp. JJ722]|uniref:BC1872 family protein n=1 Tax=Bacillus sp. JJ722 TaxID=3122973 RepID=UPI002FFEFC11
MESIEIDQLIAEYIMGWKVWKPDFSNVGIYITDKNLITYQFSPSKHPQDAFLVVQKLREKRRFELQNNFYNTKDEKYVAIFQHKEENKLIEDRASGETESMAICLAALKTMGVLD